MPIASHILEAISKGECTLFGSRGRPEQISKRTGFSIVVGIAMISLFSIVTILK
jgi:hypothetical protein